MLKFPFIAMELSQYESQVHRNSKKILNSRERIPPYEVFRKIPPNRMGMQELH